MNLIDGDRKHLFRKILLDEIPQMFQLIVQRVNWMDEVGIKQWNITNYIETYPITYYEEKYQNGEVFVLIDIQANEIISAAVLKESDIRWKDDCSEAFYVHNFVSKIGCKGAGKKFLEEAEKYAYNLGKCFLRLDSAIDNKELGDYYESLGYLSKGTCQDGIYTGVLREKTLRT